MNKIELSQIASKLKSDCISLLRKFEDETGLPAKIIAEGNYNLQNGTQYYSCNIDIHIKSYQRLEP